jgi:hypothetical protein
LLSAEGDCGRRAVGSADTPGLAAARATQQREQERAAHAKERRIRRRERLEQYDEEYRLREQRRPSPPPR